MRRVAYIYLSNCFCERPGLYFIQQDETTEWKQHLGSPNKRTSMKCFDRDSKHMQYYTFTVDKR